jgi:hypothetical protein
MNQQVSQLSLYDIAGTPGVGADVSHINTRAQVKVSIWCAIDITPSHDGHPVSAHHILPYPSQLSGIREGQPR